MSVYPWQEALYRLEAKAVEKAWSAMMAQPFVALWLIYKETTESEDGDLDIISDEQQRPEGWYYVDPQPIRIWERYQLVNWIRFRTGRLAILPRCC